jgi:flagellar basal-body rod protein FlgB
MLRLRAPRKSANSSCFARLIGGWNIASGHYHLEHAIPPLKGNGAMTGKLDAAFGFHETALRLRSERQQLLASNIANADTPNYKARDFDFASALQQATGQADPGSIATPELTRTAPHHLAAGSTAGNGANPPLLYRTGTQGGVDGNSVDMDVERNAFTDNAVRYEASITLINAQIKNMLTAIQG